jgi:hypothetical protein
VAEGGGLLNLTRSCRFNLPNNLHVGASALKWGDAASFGCICSPLCSPILVRQSGSNRAIGPPEITSELPVKKAREIEIKGLAMIDPASSEPV